MHSLAARVPARIRLADSDEADGNGPDWANPPQEGAAAAPGPDIEGSKTIALDGACQGPCRGGPLCLDSGPPTPRRAHPPKGAVQPMGGGAAAAPGPDTDGSKTIALDGARWDLSCLDWAATPHPRGGAAATPGPEIEGPKTIALDGARCPKGRPRGRFVPTAVHHWGAFVVELPSPATASLVGWLALAAAAEPRVFRALPLPSPFPTPFLPPHPPPHRRAVCFYVGQNVEAVIRDFANSVELVSLEDDLVAEARRVLGKCVRPNAFNQSFFIGGARPWTA